MSSAEAPRLGADARQMLPAWIAFLALAVIAWAVTISQARGMDMGTGTMGLALPAFLAIWVVMMAAMMFPSVAPVAIMWVKSIRGLSSGALRAWRMTSFTAGYLLAWAAFGVFAFAVLTVVDRVLGVHPSAGRWIGAGVFAVAGVYQLTPLKDVCLRHCRSPIGQLLHYGGFRGPAKDLRVGGHHGLFCVGCCWGLMIVLVAVGVMNVGVMVALAAVIGLEKMWRRGELLARVVGGVFLVLAVAVLFFPGLAPGVHAAPMMTGM
jgi:predicted metal-binding membrane protein